MSENVETKKSLKKPLIIIASVICAVVVLVAGMALLVSGEGVARGVCVEGKWVSGMSYEELTEFVAEIAEKEIPDKTVTVTLDGKDYQIAFADAISGYDENMTVESAYNSGRDKNAVLNFFTKVGFIFKNKNIHLEPTMDEEYIGQFVNQMCEGLQPVKTDDYWFMEEDKIKLVYGNEGNFVDVELFRKQLDEFLRKGESGKITLNVVHAEPAPFDVNEIYENVASQPSNTYYEEKEGKKYIVPAKNGYEFDKNELKKAIDENRGVNESFYFVPEVIKPDNTTLDETGLFTEVLAEYTSKITDQDKNRLNNVHLATSKINGVIINPDDVFKYLGYVEPITVEGGYKSANVYANGKILKDIGGGVCQVSSALYSAVLYANLEVVKRYNHSLTVGYVPYGQDATVASGEIDFRFKNNTNEPVKIIATSDNAGVHITIMGKKPDPSVTIEIENVITQTLVPEIVEEIDESLNPGEEVVDYAGKTGYVVQTYKHIYKNGTLAETIHVSTSRYKKIDKTIRKGPDAGETIGQVTGGEVFVDIPVSEEIIYPETQPEQVPQTQPEQPQENTEAIQITETGEAEQS
ncbi:MAG: VanW family protein [Clostridia bacterium]|nr:VanW family protein [Clostridia bacterium]